MSETITYSKNYEKALKYYNEGKWDKEKLRNIVGKKYGITEDEYELITSEEYIV